MITLQLIGAPAFTVEVRTDGELRYAAINDALCAASGICRESFVGSTPEAYFPGEMGERLAARYRLGAENGSHEYLDLFDLPSGQQWWRVTVTFVAEATAERRGFLLGICSDVTDAKRSEADLREANARLTLAFEALQGACWHLDPATETFEASPGLALLAGEPAPRVLSLSEWRSLIVPRDRARVSLAQLITGMADHLTTEYRIRQASGAVRWMRCSSRLMRDESGAPLRILGVTLDITDQKLRELDLIRDASRDSLTGLANRRACDEHLERAVAKASRNEERIAVLALDLDGFKPVNDCFGHAIGDQVLVEAARRIRRALRPYDLASRIGGDEFVILAEGLDAPEAHAVMDRIQAEFVPAFDTEAGPIAVGVSIGMAHYGAGATAASILREADANLYEAKRRSRSRRFGRDRAA